MYAASCRDIESMLTIVMIKVRVWLQYFSNNAGLGDVHTPTLSLSPGGMVHESVGVQPQAAHNGQIRHSSVGTMTQCYVGKSLSLLGPDSIWHT